ncbi:MAG: PEP-CTERM sorting domain-containing protein [Blastocatellia bacterium]|nr:PEP-CTERM sorting domain-containing protein [Blastocatellia bacterium]
MRAWRPLWVQSSSNNKDRYHPFRVHQFRLKMWFCSPTFQRSYLWAQTSNHGKDTLTISAPGLTAPVPEPATLLLLGTGRAAHQTAAR